MSSLCNEAESLSLDKERLIDDAATVMQDVLGTIVTAELNVETIDLESLRVYAVKDKVAHSAELVWGVAVTSPYRNVSRYISIPMTVAGGKIVKPAVFRDSVGKLYPLDPAVLGAFIHLGVTP